MLNLVSRKILLLIGLFHLEFFQTLIPFLCNGCGIIALTDSISVVSPIANIGHNNSLFCNIPLNENVTVFQVNWFLNSQQLTIPSDKYKKSSTNVLTVVNLTMTDLGKYQCMKSTQYGNLLGIPQSLMLDQLTSPSIVLRTQSNSVFEGDIISLNCSFEFSSNSKLLPAVTWIKNGSKLLSVSCNLQSPSSLSVCSDGASKSLYISNSSVTDSGLYSCRVQLGLIKKTSRPIEIKVRPTSQTASSNGAIDRLFEGSRNSNYPERVIHYKKKVYGNRQLLISCGLPIVRGLNLNWRVKKTVLERSTSRSYSFKKHFGNTLISLKISSMSAGLYNITCFAVSNSASTNGTQLSQTTLLFLHTNFDYCDLTGFYKQIVPFNTSTMFTTSKCNLHSFTTDNKWFFNGVAISPSSKNQAVSPDGHSLRVTNISESLSGFYQKLTITPVDSFMASYQLTARNESELLPQLNISVTNITSYSALCHMHMNFSNTRFPICGIVICSAVNELTSTEEQSAERVNLSENVHSYVKVTTRFSNLPANSKFRISGRWLPGVSGNKRIISTSSNKVVIVTKEARPSRCPCFYVSREDKNSITVRWELLPQSDRNGEIFEHQISWHQAFHLAQRFTVKVAFNVTSYRIEGLLSGMKYLIKVQSATRVGACRGAQLMLTGTTSRLLPKQHLLQKMNVMNRALNWTMPSASINEISKLVVAVWTSGVNSTEITVIPSTVCNHTISMCVTGKIIPARYGMVRVEAYAKDTGHLLASRLVYISRGYTWTKMDSSVTLKQECYNKELYMYFNSSYLYCQPCSLLLENSFIDSSGIPVHIMSKVNPIYSSTYLPRNSILLENPKPSQAIVSRLRCYNYYYGHHVMSQPAQLCSPVGISYAAVLPAPRFQCQQLNDSSWSCGPLETDQNLNVGNFVVRIKLDNWPHWKILRISKENPTFNIDNENDQFQAASCHSETFCSVWSDLQFPGGNGSTAAFVSRNLGDHSIFYISFALVLVCASMVLIIPSILSRRRRRKILNFVK